MSQHGLLNQLPLRSSAPRVHRLLAESIRRAASLPLYVCSFLLLISLSQSTLADSTVPSITPGGFIDAGQWRVKPVSAQLSSEHPLRRHPPPGASYLLVEVEFTNLMDRSSRDYAFVVRVDQPALAKLGEPSLVLKRDMDLPDRLHPNMPEAMLLVWPWPTDVPPPAQLQVSIAAKTYKAVDNLVGSPGWFNPTVVASATLPLGAQ